MRIDADKLIAVTEEYIKTSAENASKVFELLNFNHQFFEGTTIGMTSKMCEETYKDIIRDLAMKNAIAGQRYGLFVLIALLDDDRFNLQLGLTFPEMKE